MATPIDITEAGERWRLLVTYDHAGPGQPDSLEILRVEWWLTWSECLSAWLGFSVGGDEPNGFTEPDKSPIYWHAGLHYKLTDAFEDRINADSALRERIVEKCLAASCD